MYSLVLMTAVAGAPDVAAGGPLGGGCYGAACYGSACYGSGCYGGPAFPLARTVIGFPFRVVGGVVNAVTSFGGCYGSASCYGCYGSSVYGGCYGSAGLGSAAVYGGCYGSGCFGSACYGGSGCGGAFLGADISVPHVDAMAFAGTTTSTSAKLVEADAPATLTVTLPAGATLFVDGAPVVGDGSVRRFHTPALALGKTFYYELRAEVAVAGKPVPEEMKVLVRSGDAREVRFEKLLAAANAGSGVLASK